MDKSIEEKFDNWLYRVTGIEFQEKYHSVLEVGFCNGYMLAKEEDKVKIEKLIDALEDVLDRDDTKSFKKAQQILREVQ